MDSDMQVIQEAIEELEALNCIKSISNNLVTIDTKRLFNLGYSVIYSVEKRIPILINNCELPYISVSHLYMHSVVPVSTLRFYKLVSIKNIYISR